MKKTAQYLRDRKTAGEKLAVLTCYDYPSATWQEAAGVDVIFVGDSVGTNVLGYGSEREVTMDDMLHHLKAVRRGVQEAYLLADLPYGTCDTPAGTLENALRFASLGADGVKLEGFRPDLVEALAGRHIGAWGHLGYTPQHHPRAGLQARTAAAGAELMEQCAGLERAGASAIVLELVPEEVAEAITARLAIPTIGIGAGRGCDGQVLVVSDLLGINRQELRHLTRYEDFQARGRAALTRWVDDVRAGRFPGAEHTRHLSAAELEAFERWLTGS
ncbi:MAG: 3-methyl-2-oxobutanoate hydroxymethyltransferase [Gemmatimonadota bacterium]